MIGILNIEIKCMKNSQICSESDIPQDVLETQQQQQWKLFRLCLAETENKSKTD